MYTITGMSANEHDVSETSKLLWEDDHVAYGDSGYLGAPNRLEIKENEGLSKIEFRINIFGEACELAKIKRLIF